MESVELTRPITVKVIMTPAFRERIIEEARSAIEGIDRNLEILESTAGAEIESREEDPRKAQGRRQQLEHERARLIRRREELDWRIKEAQGVKDGAILPFQVYQGSVRLQVGDNFLEKMAETEVILKDWEVVAIRRADATPQEAGVRNVQTPSA